MMSNTASEDETSSTNENIVTEHSLTLINYNILKQTNKLLHNTLHNMRAKHLNVEAIQDIIHFYKKSERKNVFQFGNKIGPPTKVTIPLNLEFDTETETESVTSHHNTNTTNSSSAKCNKHVSNQPYKISRAKIPQLQNRPPSMLQSISEDSSSDENSIDDTTVMQSSISNSSSVSSSQFDSKSRNSSNFQSKSSITSSLDSIMDSESKLNSSIDSYSMIDSDTESTSSWFPPKYKKNCQSQSNLVSMSNSNTESRFQNYCKSNSNISSKLSLSTPKNLNRDHCRNCEAVSKSNPGLSMSLNSWSKLNLYSRSMSLPRLGSNDYYRRPNRTSRRYKSCPTLIMSRRLKPEIDLGMNSKQRLCQSESNLNKYLRVPTTTDYSNLLKLKQMTSSNADLSTFETSVPTYQLSTSFSSSAENDTYQLTTETSDSNVPSSFIWETSEDESADSSEGEVTMIDSLSKLSSQKNDKKKLERKLKSTSTSDLTNKNVDKYISRRCKHGSLTELISSFDLTLSRSSTLSDIETLPNSLYASSNTIYTAEDTIGIRNLFNSSIKFDDNWRPKNSVSIGNSLNKLDDIHQSHKQLISRLIEGEKSERKEKLLDLSLDDINTSDVSSGSVNITIFDVNTSIFNQSDPTPQTGFLIPIVNRGKFFEDNWFKALRLKFMDAVYEVLQMFKIAGASTSFIYDYRMMRAINPSEENQATAIFQEDEYHIVLLDVDIFLEQGIQVRLLEASQIIIEEVLTNNNKSKNTDKGSIIKQFALNKCIFTSQIECVLSLDGILVICIKYDEESCSESQSQKMLKNDDATDCDFKLSSDSDSDTDSGLKTEAVTEYETKPKDERALSETESSSVSTSDSDTKHDSNVAELKLHKEDIKSLSLNNNVNDNSQTLDSDSDSSSELETKLMSADVPGSESSSESILFC